MSTLPSRLDKGGLIDRDRPIHFSFNGRVLQGYQGDTLASALLANNIRIVNRSIKLHRPRGIFAAGPEEPNAIVQIGDVDSPHTLPNQCATQVELYEGLRARSINGWPSVQFDLMGALDYFRALLPAAFYYKTFMWPKSLWMRYEHLIRKAAGFGVAPSHPDPDIYDKRYAHCDVLVVGAGPAGVAAAHATAQTGARTWLVEAQSCIGGSLLYRGSSIEGQSGDDWLANSLKQLQRFPNFTLKTRTTAAGLFDHNFITLLERVSDHLPLNERQGRPRQCFWKLRARRIVLATGAIERPLVFKNNDLPGAMLASASAQYVKQYAVRPGLRTLVYTNNDSAYFAACILQQAGIGVAAIVDVRAKQPSAAQKEAEQMGISILHEHAVVDVCGKKAVSGARIAPLVHSERRDAPSSRFDCDLIVSSGGWNPAIHLHAHVEGRLRWDDKRLCFVPEIPQQHRQQRQVVGAANGKFALDDALSEGWEAGLEMATSCGHDHISARKQPPAAQANTPVAPIAPLWSTPAPNARNEARKFVDLQNDTTAADIQLAVREGYTSVEHVKRYTALGFGTDQGKSGNINGMGILAQTLGKSIPETGTTTFRPPYTPITFGAISGNETGDLLDPIRVTPMHTWHEAAGALFENVGQWKRAWYYPKDGEDIHAAVARECRAARNSVGVLDYSTLGKIDIQGADSAEFLNRVYTNGWKQLAVGRCRYGLMLGEDGMIIDDGVTTRIGEQHYLMTTTTGGAARVLTHLERWLQTEWPELKVHLCTVTDHDATVAIAGPNSRKLLAMLTDDIPLSGDEFPFMSSRTGTVAGIPARVTRVSFTGELSFEVMVPASYGLSLWEAVMGTGEAFDATPYGTETMHVLRAEKGFIIVGQDTDGSMTPTDMGMSWIVNMNKGEFIGRRSLSRPHCVEKQRKQMVGLLTVDPKTVLPEGTQLVDNPGNVHPTVMIGHVSSSYWSEALQRSIALALVKGGHDRTGGTIYAALGGSVHGGSEYIASNIVSPVFYDPEGEHQND